MKLYCITDNIKEQIVDVFSSKNDNTALKEFNKSLQQINPNAEVSLISLGITILEDDTNDEFRVLVDYGEEYQEALVIDSFPKTKEFVDVSAEIVKQAEEEIKGDDK